MTEEDTFNRLKRLSVEEMYEKWLNSPIIPRPWMKTCLGKYWHSLDNTVGTIVNGWTNIMQNISSEDDTFNTLKKWDFRKLNDEVLMFSSSWSGTWDDFAKARNLIFIRAGWTHDEYFECLYKVPR